VEELITFGIGLLCCMAFHKYFQSSVNIMNVPRALALDMSLIYSRKSNGPKTDP
jgi:hypothetical protein